MATYGQTSTSPANVIGASGSGVRATVFGAMPEHGWAYQLTTAVENASARPVRFQVWGVDGNGAPTALRGSSAEFTSAATSTLQTLTRALTTPVPLVSGSRYAPGFAFTGTLDYYHTGRNGAGDSYSRSGTSTTGPFDPMGWTGQGGGRAAAVSIEYAPNVAPSAPTGLSPSGQTNQGTLTLTAPFVDGNQTVNGQSNAVERLTQFRIQIRDPADTSGALITNALIDATSQEQANAAFAWDYSGATLASGTTYEWRCQVADWFGAFSDWSAWTAFTVGPGGALTAVAGRLPASGQTERAVQPIAIPAVWTHPQAKALNGYRIQFRQGGTVARDATIASSVANGGTLLILPTVAAWTAAGLAPLSRGVTYTVWAAGRDTDNVFFGLKLLGTMTINAAPLTPTGLSPNLAPSAPIGAIPVLSFAVSDADDTAATGASAQVVITTATGAGGITRTATKRAGDNAFWDYQPTLAELKAVQGNATGYGDFVWKAAGVDTVGTGTQSSGQTFTYALVPAPVLTAPTADQVVANTPFSFTWTVVDQVSRRVRIYRAGTDSLVYDSGTATTASTSLNIGLGALTNNANYEATVTVTNSQGNTGTTQRRPFRLQYAPAVAPTNFQARGLVIGNDAAATSIEVLWDQTLLGSEFAGYTLQKHRVDAPFQSDWATVFTSTSASATRFVDVYPWTGAQYQYRLRQDRQVGATKVQGEWSTTPPIEIAFTGVLMTDARNVNGDRALIPIVSDRETEYIADSTELDVWDDGPPALAESGQAYRRISFTARLVQESLQDDSVEVQLNRIRRLAGFRSDRSPLVILYRDGSGRAAMMRLRLRTDRQITPYYLEVDCELTEVASDVRADGAVKALISAADALVDVG